MTFIGQTRVRLTSSILLNRSGANEFLLIHPVLDILHRRKKLRDPGGVAREFGKFLETTAQKTYEGSVSGVIFCMLESEAS